MKPYYEQDGATIFLGDCLDVMKGMRENSVDTVVTDPPAGISFMGKKWDNKTNYEPRTERGITVLAAFSDLLESWEAGFLAFIVDYAVLALRVAKPGAMNLTWAIPRTSDLVKMGLRLGGWEVKNSFYHCFGSGFPKSLDISKAMDKAAGAEREVVGKHTVTSGGKTFHGQEYKLGEDLSITAPATEAAKLWDGWGTATKPAVEEWILAMKPREGTFAANALKWGVAGLWVDGGRIKMEHDDRQGYIEKRQSFRGMTGKPGGGWKNVSPQLSPEEFIHNSQKGRWPSNLLLSHVPDSPCFCAGDWPDCPYCGGKIGRAHV